MIARIAVVGLMLMGTMASPLAAQERPNFVLIYADDLDFDEVHGYDPTKFPSRTGGTELGLLPWKKGWNCYPGETVMTRNLDSLAREGVIFDHKLNHLGNLCVAFLIDKNP